MNKRNCYTKYITFAIMSSVFLFGCSKESNEGTERPEPTESGVPLASDDSSKTETDLFSDMPNDSMQESSETETDLSPDMLNDFLQESYEAYEVDDMYHLPLDGINDNFEVRAMKFAGDYALFWITDVGSSSSDKDQATECLILTRPGVDTKQYKLTLDAYFGDITLLEDGMVLASELESNEIHVYDNTLTLVRTFVAGKGEGNKIAGFTEDGTVWTVDEENFQLLATDISGNTAGKYTFDKERHPIFYLGEIKGQSCFETISDDGNDEHGFMYLSISSGKSSYRDYSESELGAELEDSEMLLDGIKMIQTNYTWVLYNPGYVGEMVIFPNCDQKEEYSFIQGKKLCTQKLGEENKDRSISEYRLYDLDHGTVSEVSINTDQSSDSYFEPRGIVGENIVVARARNNKGNNIVLWDASQNSSEIKNFGDFSRKDPREYLSEQLAGLKDDLHVVITPDQLDNKQSDYYGRLITELDFINTFAVGTLSDPEVLTSKSGEFIHLENMRNNEGTTHVFNPHVFSKCYLEEHGEKSMESFFHYVDAVRAGEERFQCPDPEAAGWCSGRFATFFFPPAVGCTYAEYEGDGWAKIDYLIPKEKLSERLNDFEQRVCAIIDDVIEDDYTDLEKVLSLYEFLTEYIIYDYDELESQDFDWANKESPYRVLTDRTGICWEISGLYEYLLLQCQVDIEEAGGLPSNEDGEPHVWNHVTLDGKSYLIDATWGLTADRKPNLKYFLFTDEMRITRDSFLKDSLTIADYGNNDNVTDYSYDCNDDRYQELWNGRYIAFDQNEKCIFYWDEDDVIQRFDY